MKETLRFPGRLAAVLLLLLTPLFFSGCSEVKEINDMAIVSGLAVDVTADGVWKVSAEVVNKTAKSSPEETRQVITAYGDTLGDALENCNFQDSRQIYFSHAKTLAVSKRLAETEGIGSIADYVMRNYKTRLSIDLLVSDLPDAAAISDLTSSSSGLIYYDLEEMVKTDHRYGACSPTKVYQAVNTLRQRGTELTIPLVSSQEDRAVLAGTAVFRQDRMAGTLTPDETLYLLLLQDHLEAGHLTLPERNMTFQIIKGHTNFQSSGDPAKPSLDVTIDLTCSLAQAGSAVSFGDTEQLSQELSDSIGKRCADLIRKAQDWDTDIFGFGKSMGGLSYNFAELPVTVNCEINVKLGEVH